MLKKTLLAAASVAAVSIGAASAGELKVRLINVNTGAGDHTDTNVEGCPGNPLLGLTNCTGKVTVEKPFVDTDGDGVDNAVEIAAERFVDDVLHPVQGHFEVEIYDITGEPSLRDPSTVIIEVGGTAMPFWKEDLSFPQIVRPGSDGIFSAVAEPISGDLIERGRTTASAILTPSTENGILIENAIGFVLPLEFNKCDAGQTVDVTITVVSDIPGGGANTRSDTTTIAVCGDSLVSGLVFNEIKVDYATDFKSWLIDPNPSDDVEEHVASRFAEFGMVAVSLEANLVDLKAPIGDPVGIFGIEDIEYYTLELTFEDLTGIKTARLDGVEPVEINRAEQTVRWVLAGGDLAAVFPNIAAGGVMKGDEITDSAIIELEAFGPGKPKFEEVPDGKGGTTTVATGAGAIDHQQVDVTINQFKLTPEKDLTKTAIEFSIKFDPELNQVPQPSGFITKTGMNFGPFDWTSDGDDGTEHVFRVTHVPLVDGHGEAIEEIKGHVEIKAPTNGTEFEGPFKFTMPNPGNKELVFTSAMLESIVGGKFGRGDVSFTFYVNEPKMDVDRMLLRSNIVTPYGDNGNDAFSIKALSCDDGRFGNHVANKLTAEFKQFLIDSCLEGEIERDLEPHDDN